MGVNGVKNSELKISRSLINVDNRTREKKNLKISVFAKRIYENSKCAVYI
jgi:hypothetical protein